MKIAFMAVDTDARASVVADDAHASGASSGADADTAVAGMDVDTDVTPSAAAADDAHASDTSGADADMAVGMFTDVAANGSADDAMTVDQGAAAPEKTQARKRKRGKTSTMARRPRRAGVPGASSPPGHGDGAGDGDIDAPPEEAP